MSRESQQLAVSRLTKAIAFIRELPEWVEVRVVDVSRHDDYVAEFQINTQAFLRLFAGHTVLRYANGKQANGMLGDFKLYASLPRDPDLKEAIEDGDYFVPFVEESAVA